MVSIVVPVLNEEKNIKKALEKLRSLKGNKEIIVVDGGSIDNTVSIARSYARVVLSSKGRAIQMNTGAKLARGEIIWFVHSDSVLEVDSILEIEKEIELGFIGGGFSLYFYDSKSYFMRYIALTSNIRASLLKMFFGDQGIFIRRDKFIEVGGFPEIDIMEDLEYSKRIAKLGRIRRLKKSIGTSSRRFTKGGLLKTFLLMQKLKVLYILGVDPKKLSDMYRDVR